MYNQKNNNDNDNDNDNDDDDDEDDDDDDDDDYDDNDYDKENQNNNIISLILFFRDVIFQKNIRIYFAMVLYLQLFVQQLHHLLHPLL